MKSKHKSGDGGNDEDWSRAVCGASAEVIIIIGNQHQLHRKLLSRRLIVLAICNF